MLTDEQLTNAINRHVSDHVDYDAKPVEISLKEDLNQHLQYTNYKWDDGVPVTKYYTRNDEIPVFIPKGTKLRGMTFVGSISGALIFEFYYGNTWYCYKNAEHLFEE